LQAHADRERRLSSDHLRALVATSSANTAGFEISNVGPSDSYFGGHGGPGQVVSYQATRLLRKDWLYCLKRALLSETSRQVVKGSCPVGFCRLRGCGGERNRRPQPMETFMTKTRSNTAAERFGRTAGSKQRTPMAPSGW